MKKIIIGIISIILLSSCSNNELKEKKFLMENNNKCIALNDEIKEKEGKLLPDCGSIKIIKSFYSYSLNTCIHLIKSEILDCTTLNNKYSEYNYKLMDYYNQELIIKKQCNVNENEESCLKNINNKIKELKN